MLGEREYDKRVFEEAGIVVVATELLVRVGDSQPDGQWNQVFPKRLFGYSNQWQQKKQVNFQDPQQFSGSQNWG